MHESVYDDGQINENGNEVLKQSAVYSHIMGFLLQFFTGHFFKTLVGDDGLFSSGVFVYQQAKV